MKKLLARLQLVRFPNVFAILADILTAAFLTASLQNVSPERWTAYGISGIGAVLLYWAGMILNDVFDVQEDSILRTDRPIPSGRISLETARRTGWIFLVFGVFLAGLPAQFVLPVGGLSPTLFIAPLLAACILLYDAKLKNTPLGPFFMGLCRGLNVLLFLSFRPLAELAGMGVSAGGSCGNPSPILLYPLALTIYITGVTFYARCETEDAPEAGVRRPGTGAMLFSVLLSAAGLALLIQFPSMMAEYYPGGISPIFQAEPWRWTMLLAFLMLFLAFRSIVSYFQGPIATRNAVRQALFTVFLMDAALVTAVCPIGCTLVIFALFFCASFAGKWVYST